MNKFITIGTAARMLGVTIHTMRSWFDAGKIRGRRTPGGQRQIYSKDVKALLEPQVVSDTFDTSNTADSANDAELQADSEKTHNQELDELAQEDEPSEVDELDELMGWHGE